MNKGLSPLFRLQRPAIIVCASGLFEIFILLARPQAFPYVLAFSVVLSALLFALLYKSSKVLGLICAIFLILPCFTSKISVTQGSVRAKDFATLMGSEEHVYTADIYECERYSTYTVCYARLTGFDGKNLDEPLDVRVGSFYDERLEIGDSIEFSGKIKHVSSIENDGFNTTVYLMGRGVFLDASYAEIISSSIGDKAHLLSYLREGTKKIIYKYLPREFDFNGASIAYASFTGDSTYISRETNDVFSESGTTHLICVSGMHLAVLAGFLLFILSGLTLPKWSRFLITALFCVLYTAFTGFSLSTLRACIMCCISFGALIFGQKSDGYISLFLSALFICTANPYSIYDISLLLSFAATFGIIATVNVFSFSYSRNPLINAIKGLLTALFIGIGANIFVLPISAAFFGTVGIYSVPATLGMSLPFDLLLMLVVCLVSLSFLQIFPFGEAILGFIGYLCESLCGVVMSVANFFASFDFSSITAENISPYVISFAVLVCILTLFVSIGTKRAIGACLIAIFAVNVLFIGSYLNSTAEDNKLYKLVYYRKNESDRQLNLKLGEHGYLLINADNNLCKRKDKCDFDTKHGENSLLIVPDKDINPSILARNIKNFSEEYGIREVFVPNSENGLELLNALADHGINAKIFPQSMICGDIIVNFDTVGGYTVSVDDGKVLTTVAFADSYSTELFNGDEDICAFFTRKTKNQFDIQTDIRPSCSIFFTRLKKGQEFDGIFNTNSLQSFYIKE